MLLKLILLTFISICAIFCDNENDVKACKKRKKLEKMLAMHSARMCGSMRGLLPVTS